MRKTNRSPYVDPKSSQEARARRVKSLRQMTRLSRRAFAEKFGIPASTLQNWEDIGANGLSEKGAIKLTRVLKFTGIHCSIEWLLHGVGASPIISERLYLDSIQSALVHSPHADDKEMKLIAAELLLFREHYQQQVMDMVVQDDGMYPTYVEGQYIAGVRNLTSFHCFIGRDCIIQTEEGVITSRQLRLGSIPDHFNLVCTNSQTILSKPIQYDVRVVAVAPIIWCRSKYSPLNLLPQ